MTITTTQHHLIVTADAPDGRDRYYAPPLTPLCTRKHPPGNLHILEQGAEGACTGFGLAAVINLLYRQRDDEEKVSPRMLYEMAKRYDKWPGEDYEGSSCRGAIKGWRNTGVCLESLAPYTPKDTSFVVTPAISQDARNRTIGAYYRLRPVISDFHAALNEAGVVYASAQVHSGWFKLSNTDGEATIPLRGESLGGHAFAIVGYNEKGFWIQNSWGDSWGDSGLALWLYEDWARSLMDAWVVQLALPTPQIFDLSSGAGQGSSANTRATGKSVPRVSIEEHFVHIDDGKFHDKGKYWSNKDHIAIVQNGIGKRKCKHLLIYAHGGLNSIKASARRIAAMKPVLLANGIYPFHFMYDTGLMEELKDVIFGKSEEANERSAGVRDWFDRRIEDMTRKTGTALWREMKSGARKPFEKAGGDGSYVLGKLLDSASSNKMKIHVSGHSTGAILQAYLLTRLHQKSGGTKVATCSLLAPAATNDLYNTLFVPLLVNKTIQDMAIYNLTDKFELDDNVAYVYGKSLLYLVSRAFEEKSVEEILGMQKYNSAVTNPPGVQPFVYSNGGKSGRTTSTSHGGFDNDPRTMNDILKRILNVSKPPRPFTKSDLDY